YKDDNHCFACGKLNPNGLHMKVDRNQGRAQAELVLKPEHQGWKGMAHGGLVSTVLDEIMAHAVIDQVPQAATVELTVRFKAPVPLGKPLEAKGWISYRNKRLIKAEGELRLKASDQLLAQAESKFIVPSPSNASETLS
ncbi:MAG: PaaI family thioesterase, partial [Deltaproteobacteria bacterium]|nr:PaaI family thioesterase [Deltaproteobacteria bacterium]